VLIWVIVAQPEIMFFSIFLCYILSGPVGYLMRLMRRPHREKSDSA